MKKLTQDEIDASLKLLDNWHTVGDAIQKNFVFKNHISAFGFLAKIAVLAEKADHHPNWSGVYNKVTIMLTTHDLGGVSAKDIHFAKEVDGFDKD